MTDRRVEAGRRIVRWHAGWAAGASIIPLPFADMAGVMAVQVSMVRRLARLHGARMGHARARTLVLSALGGAVSPSVTAMGIPSMLKAVPGIGTVLGGVAAPASAVAATVALGNFFNQRLAEEGRATAPEVAPAASPEPRALRHEPAAEVQATAPAATAARSAAPAVVPTVVSDTPPAEPPVKAAAPKRGRRAVKPKTEESGAAEPEDRKARPRRTRTPTGKGRTA